MVPLKLELYNFLAYHQPEPLDLSGVHVACLAGANGAGKSTLLDSITWALWGKARAGRDNDLIHMHRSRQQTEMRVALTFRLGTELYRVIRYRSSQGRGSTLLELHIADGESWRMISEPTVRATQDKINRLIKLDYDTFINSAYLVQGRADEFTRKTPAERKSIIGEILGLGLWERYEERAKQLIKQIQSRIAAIDTHVAEIDRELSQEVRYQQDLIEAQRQLHELIEQRQGVESQVRALDLIHREYMAQQSARQEAERAVLQAEADLNRSREEHQRYIRRISDNQATLEAGPAIEANYAALQVARHQDRQMSDLLMSASSLRGQIAELDRIIDRACAQLEAEQTALLQNIERLQREQASAEDEAALSDTQARIGQLEAIRLQIAGWREEMGDIRQQRAGLEASNQALRAEMDALRTQIDQIKAAQTAHCPLCEQELTPDHRAELITRLERTGKERREAYDHNRAAMNDLTARITQLEEQIKLTEPEQKNLPALQRREADLLSRIERAGSINTESLAVQARLAAVDQTLAQMDYAQAEQNQRAELAGSLAALGYDEAQHRALQAHIQELEPFEAQKQQLERALEALAEAESASAKLAEQQRTFEGRMAEAQARLSQLDASLGQLGVQLQDYDRLQAHLSDLRDQEGLARHEVGAAEQRLRALDQQKVMRENLLTERQQAAEEQATYEELQAAFGRNGVPAMIIEAAIPEIENEANDILARMTDGRMHLRFETQREKVTGGVAETLDITISDELGTRDYNLYSGGEALRVNFAIRLALSRLLARRAGTQLRTLIIDEGFGTQDAQGRERLVQAINAVQEEFDLILVITHIDELKDAFPVRIEVTKTPDGSQMEIV